MNSCMIQYASQKEHDAAREEWLATMELRRHELEEKGRKKAEDEKFFQEWWDIPKSSSQKGDEIAKNE